MESINCVVCGKEFIPTRAGHLCCCRKCRNLYTLTKKPIKCANCGKEFYRTKLNEKFCSPECKHEYKINTLTTKQTCLECGKEFDAFSFSKFCSNLCKERYRAKSGALSVVATCDYCGRKYVANKYSLSHQKSDYIPQNYEGNKHFCSHSCCMAYLYQHGIITAKMSSLHLQIVDMLNELGIANTIEYPIDKYSLDIKLINYNKGIEIMGTYWHGDSRKYQLDLLETRQSKCIEKDKRKLRAVNDNDIDILYLWLSDITSHFDMCRQLILLFIEDLLNYKHSSSYTVKDGELITTECNLYME